MAALVTVRYWAGARRAAGRESEQLCAVDLTDLLAQLSSRTALAPVIAASAVLVDEVTADPAQPLHEGAVVDVLPPFAGG
ncbi:MAG TPA: MoaD/ThiS family protein [Jatrophihabitans sp.]|nr:MoaD/ThiS family protein [Jatrophihabitans sp.]